jgi:nanoRNase/pAp phosphatase (c-di-AMP/oligoRNAs hydrolase)
MNMLGQKIVENVKAAKTISICTNEISSLDKLYAVVSLHHLLTSLGKKVSFFVATKPVSKFLDILEEESVEAFERIDPVKYVIRIDYSKTPIEKVSYDNDEKTGKINLYITPTGHEFDFDNIEYTKEGGEFDQMFVIGCRNFNEMGEIYSQNTSLFKMSKAIVISRRFDTEIENFVKIQKDKSFSSTIYDFVKELGFEITAETAQSLMTGIIDFSNVLEGCEVDLPLELLATLKVQGANTYNSLKKVYFSKSYANFFVQQILMRNIKVDNTNKIVWSVVEYSDIVKAGIDANDLDVKGRIAFNLSDDYDLYIAAYEFEQEKLKLVLQSNKPERYSAIKIAGVFEGKGSETCASCIIKNATANDFENVVYTVLKDLYAVILDQSAIKQDEAVKVSEDDSDNNLY